MIGNRIKLMMTGGSLTEAPRVTPTPISSPTTQADGSVTWNPPTRFDRPFDGKETIIRMPQPEVVKACRKLFADAGLDIEVTERQKGCAVFKGKTGTITVIDRPYGGATPETVIRHERGHLNGWPADHPD